MTLISVSSFSSLGLAESPPISSDSATSPEDSTAHHPGDIGGRWLVGLQAPIAGARWQYEERYTTVGLHVGSESTPVDVALGYGLSKNWLLDGTVAVGHETHTNMPDWWEVYARPGITRLFSDGVARPYAGAQAIALFSGGYDDGQGVGGGLVGGVRLELADRLSFEPRVVVDALWQHHHYEYAAIADRETTDVRVVGAVRAAGWF